MRLFHQPTENACAGILESAEGIHCFKRSCSDLGCCFAGIELTLDCALTLQQGEYHPCQAPICAGSNWRKFRRCT